MDFQEASSMCQTIQVTGISMFNVIVSAADMLLNGWCVQLCLLFICDVVPLFPTAPFIIASGLLFGPKVRKLFREKLLRNPGRKQSLRNLIRKKS